MATPAHRKSPLPHGPRPAAIGTGVAIVAVAAIAIAAAAYGISHSSSHRTAAGGSGSGGSNGKGSATATTLPPLSVVSIAPATAATAVPSNAPIQIQFSQPLKANATRPTLTPAVAGSWTVQGSTMTFVPQGGYLPFGQVQVTVPTTTSARFHGKTTTLAAPYQASFTAAPGSTARVEQMLAELGYLPLSFVGAPAAPAPAVSATPGAAPSTTAPATPSSPAAPVPPTPGPPTPASTLAAEAIAPDAVNVLPEPGAMVWRYPNTPSSLQALWHPGQSNTVDQGAIMAFENANGMKMDGEAGPRVWAALVTAVASRHVTTRPYDYLVASEASPESLSVWQNGSVVYTSPANTGVAGAPTAKGTWPVFDRYASTTMSGSNPDGSHYSDPGIPWVAYFHGGDAVHGFDRGSFGTPQSVGCVELPPANAKVVWGLDPYGTLVTVE